MFFLLLAHYLVIFLEKQKNPKSCSHIYYMYITHTYVSWTIHWGTNQCSNHCQINRTVRSQWISWRFLYHLPSNVGLAFPNFKIFEIMGTNLASNAFPTLCCCSAALHHAWFFILRLWTQCDGGVERVCDGGTGIRNTVQRTTIVRRVCNLCLRTDHLRNVPAGQWASDLSWVENSHFWDRVGSHGGGSVFDFQAHAPVPFPTHRLPLTKLLVSLVVLVVFQQNSGPIEPVNTVWTAQKAGMAINQ